MPEDASMISRAVPRIPEEPKEMARVVKRILEQHYKDIDTLFSMTTDCDRYEQRQREIE